MEEIRHLARDVSITFKHPRGAARRYPNPAAGPSMARGPRVHGGEPVPHLSYVVRGSSAAISGSSFGWKILDGAAAGFVPLDCLLEWCKGSRSVFSSDRIESFKSPKQ